MKYKTEKDIYEEIERIIDESSEKNFEIGKSLFFQLPFFCNPASIISSWCYDIIEEYHLVKNYNVPIAENLELVNAWKMDCFNIIEKELKEIEKYKVEQNGR